MAKGGTGTTTHIPSNLISCLISGSRGTMLQLGRSRISFSLRESHTASARVHIHTHMYIRIYTRRIYVHVHTYVCVVNGVIRTHYALRSLHLPYALFIRGAFSVLSFSFSLPLCTSISFCILLEQKISPISSYSFCESSNFFRIMITFTATEQTKVN